MPVFGVPLAVAVDRSHCHDGVAIPLVVRDCIDHVQDCGRFNIKFIESLFAACIEEYQTIKSFDLNTFFAFQA